MAPQSGDIAPAISLPEGPGQMVDIDWSAGPTVILFFPLAFSGVCAEEFCTVRDDWKAFTDLDAQVFGISIDSCFVSAKFRELENLPFPLLSDFNKTTCTEWGTLLDDLMGQKGVSTRAAFVVDAEGRVVYASVQDNPGEMVDFEAIKNALKTASGATA